MNDLLQWAMRISSHSDMYNLWLRAKQREPLEGEEAMLARMRQEQAEYHEVWERLMKAAEMRWLSTVLILSCM
ncbi:MAG TPA: hypothetical protein VJM08_17970 [Anaerolineales bacterium]|nr:hypothetical protein [Anaerolineales bacterium]